MAEMLPPEWRSTTSNAERKVFRAIQTDLGGEWVALHSVGLACHDRKPWAEIDYVLIGPPGIFCLEVTGGRVSRKDGLWYFTDGQDNVSTKAEGPFEQVGSAAATLRRYLGDADPQ